jgi:hypothetical protein
MTAPALRMIHTALPPEVAHSTRAVCSAAALVSTDDIWSSGAGLDDDAALGRLRKLADGNAVITATVAAAPVA